MRADVKDLPCGTWALGDSFFCWECEPRAAVLASYEKITLKMLLILELLTQSKAFWPGGYGFKLFCVIKDPSQVVAKWNYYL